MQCLNIRIRGVVQGVGFRPFVYNLAHDLSVKGFITNTADGVFISAEGHGLEVFLERIRTSAPPLSKIMEIAIVPRDCLGFPDFSIRESSEAGSFTLVSSDLATCPDCLRELFDPSDRRYLYPFINCTNCGPRYSITRAVPYDRVNTTMQPFEMCRDCESEYHAPENRRFHAQPNACPVCGPRVVLKRAGEPAGAGIGDPVAASIGLLKEGLIVAVRGLGGFHLACDAENPGAVGRLRELKRKNNKPFALMAPDIGTISRYCHVSEGEETLLLSARRPIVLLRKRGGEFLPEAVAPNNRHLGFMLPYTPLHNLLFFQPLDSSRPPERPHFSALVMTSGNVAEEPILINNDDAIAKLSGIAEAFLLHDRDIFMRVDDSVLKCGSGEQEFGSCGCVSPAGSRFPFPGATFIRRSRGYVPEPISLGAEGPDVLACGADLKNTFTITKGAYAIPSQHIGDMESYEAFRFFEEALGNITAVYRAEPVAVGHDLHPGYFSTRWALSEAAKRGILPVGIQHHYAHIASVMAEKGITEKVVGVAFDGSGYGDDGTLWGGEFLIAGIGGYKRAGHLAPVPLPGGETAVREPWRAALSYMKKAAGADLKDYMDLTGFSGRYGAEKIGQVLRVAEEKAFSPLSSGAGRLFDAVSALMGICDFNTFEGEAAIALEAAVNPDVCDDYPVNVVFSDPIVIDFSMTILAVLDDFARMTDRGAIAARFHNSVARALVRVAEKLSEVNSISEVVLSGGVFQNSFLLLRVTEGLRQAGLAVHVNRLVPCNDAGISLGQAYIMRERLRHGKSGQ